MLYCIRNETILYQFEKPTHKVSVFTGTSGSGKSKFSELVVSLHRKNKKKISYYSIDDTGYVNKEPCLSIKSVESVLSDFAVNVSVNNTIIVIDETSEFLEYLNIRKISKFVNDERNSTNYFIFILRDLNILAGLSVPISEIYNVKVIRENKMNQIVHTFPDYFYNQYNSTPVIKNILCEDSKSSFFFFREYFGYTPNKNLFTSNGKDNIIRRLRELVRNNIDDLLIVIDSCAFGLKIQTLLDRINFTYSNKKIYLLDWKSYEYYLLQSRNITDKFGTVTDLQEPVYQEEQQYFTILTNYLKQYSKGGDKLPKCLDLSVKCGSQDCNDGTCACPVDSKYKYNKKEVYIHNPLNNFIFQPSNPSVSQ